MNVLAIDPRRSIMSNMGCIYGTISWLISLNIKYKRICDDPEHKAKTVYFGVYSIVVSLFTAGLFILDLWGIGLLFAEKDSAGIGVLAMWAFIAMLAIVAIVLFAELILGGLLGVMYQFRCNSRPIRWIALAVFAIAAVGLITGSIYVLGSMSF